MAVTEERGGTFQKIRLIDLGKAVSPNRRVLHVPLPRGPSLTPTEELSCRFYTLVSWDVTSPGPRFHLHAMWHRELLQRFGQSSALDDVALLMLSSHESISRGEDSLSWFNLRQYRKALKSLQSAIDNPTTRFHINTLAAIALIYRTIGGLAATNKGIHNQVIHARAMSKMLEFRGIRETNDSLEFLLAMECQIAATQECMSREVPQPCVFDSDDWGCAYVENLDQTSIAAISWRIHRQIIRWPRILNTASLLSQDPENIGRITEVLQQAISIAAKLEFITHDIEVAIRDPNICTTRKSNDPLVPVVLEFKNTTVGPLLASLYLYCITVHRFIMDMSTLLFVRSRPNSIQDILRTTPTVLSQRNIPSVDHSNPPHIYVQHDTPFVFFLGASSLTIPLTATSIDMIHTRNTLLCHKIWMMCEQARSWKPIGGLWLLNSLRGTIPLASPKMGEWIYEAVVDIEGYVHEKQEWKPETMSPQWTGWVVY
jgi:hypothetical protein